MTKTKKIGIIFAVILCFGALAFWAGQQSNKPEETSKRQDGSIIKKETRFSGETIRSGLKDMGKLQTAEYYYTHVEHIESTRKIFDIDIPLTGAQYIYSYDGVITAGIDFTNIKVNVDDNNKVVNIKLPEVERLSSEIDTNSFKIYDESNNIFNPISPSDVSISLDDLKKDEEKKAIDKGLYDKANKNACVLVENFVKSLIPKDYTIKVGE